jgi:parvulin-like peptidyl-prolyl isomerase
VLNRAWVLAVVTLLTASGFTQTPQPAPTPAAEQVTLRMIVVSSQEDAERILIQLRQGQDFATLAKEKSIDTTSDAGGHSRKLLGSVLTLC